MREIYTIISLVVIMFLLSIILFTNIGYGYESIYEEGRKLFLDDTFNVGFNLNSNIKSDEIIILNSKSATLNNICLENVNDRKELLVPITNKSDSISAKVNVDVTNTNKEYFKVTSFISKTILNPNSEDAILKIGIELIKKPTNKNETTEIKMKINVEPIY